MTRPPNIVFVVADSLRHDAAHGVSKAGIPYTWDHGTRFTEARSAGCWTLPATASLFSGLLPHQHGATSQTRQVRRKFYTLAERLAALGYYTFQSTSNPVTTDIFGLDRGFRDTQRIWKQTARRHNHASTLLALVTKARVRKKFRESLSWVERQMTDDVEATRTWMQSNAVCQFEGTLDAIAAANRRGEPAFAFVNIMECHFPYHIADTFELCERGPGGKMAELHALFHLANQTRLLTGENPISPAMLQALRERQRIAWERVAPMVDNFVKTVHQNGDTFVVFLSDHGDNFGEHNWQYHFQNVTDAGTLVPLFILEPGQGSARRISEPVSSRDVFGTTLHAAGGATQSDPVNLLREPERSVTVQESYWYNRDNRTLPQYRYNQFAFVFEGKKYRERNGVWSSTSVKNGLETEPLTLPDSNPVEDLDLGDLRSTIRDLHQTFTQYSNHVL